MRKNTLLTFAITGALCASVGGVISGTNTLTASGEEKAALLVTELFAPSGITLDPIRQDPNKQVLDNGLLLTSGNKKNTIEWQDTVSGAFSLNYLPTQTGGMYDAKALEITFTDVEDQDSFTLVIEHGETMNAYVRFNGVSAGTYYYNKKEYGYTEFANLKGLYTQFSATTVGVSFDPSTMCVYAGTVEEALFKVWDLSEEINDSRDVNSTLDPFANYRVSFKMPSFSLQSGSLLLYEVNGCKLDDLILRKSGNPSLFADFEKSAIVNKKYALPKGYGYDVIDGALEVSTKLYDGSGVLLGENLADFTPTKAEEYNVVYTATNSYGDTATQEYKLTACETVPDYQAELAWTLNDEYVLNEQVYIPELWLSGGIRLYGKELGSLTVEKDGTAYAGFENKTSGFDFTFTQAGEYAFVYHVNGDEIRYNILVDDAENRFVTAGLQSSYDKNTVIDCRDFYVLIGGEKVDFDFVVKYPSGKRYLNRKFQANEAGRYALSATARVGGKTYAFEKTFTVSEDYTDYFVALHGATIENGKSDFTGYEGVRVTTTTAGAIVEYTEPVNISKYVNQRVLSYDENDAINGIHLADTATPLIELTVDPATVGSRAAQEFFVYITDASDPTNKITINARNRSKTYAAVSAGAPEQSIRGFTNLEAGSTDKTTTIDGQAGNIALKGSTCFRLCHSFDGAYEGNTTDSVVSLYYDNEAKQLLGKPSTSKAAPNNCVIMDFDDSRYLQSDMPWGGFKSDYVYISVAVGELADSQAISCIYSIDGRSLAGEKNSAPTIEVETEDTLVGLKGQSLAVPNASATDCYSNPAKIVAKVYYEKGGNRYDVSAQNGKFNTVQSGNYVIVYTATDTFGRSSEKVIRVEVAETHAPLKAVLDDPTAEYTTGAIKDEMPILGIENVVVSGAIGKTESVCKVYAGTEEIAYKGGFFVPEKAGNYKVEYTFTDAVGRTASVSYQVKIAVPEKPVITSAIPVYAGFVRGNAYAIADLYFIDYAKANPTEQKADVYIGGKKVAGTEYKVEAKVEGKDEAQKKETVVLQYRYGEVVLKSYEIPLITVQKAAEKKLGAITIPYEKILTDRYFLTDENTLLTPTNAYFRVFAARGNAQVAFVEPLQANGFNISIDLDQTRNDNLAPIDTNIKTLKLRMVDVNDAEKSLLVEVLTDSITNKAYLCINGEVYSPVFKGSLVGATAELIKISYSNGYFYDGNGKTKLVAPLHYENGDAFEGFSGAIYVSIEVEAQDAEKATSIRLVSINDQQLSSDTESDGLNPVLEIEKQHGGIYEQGTEIELSAAKAYDVLSGINSDTLKLTVTYERDGETKYAKIGDLTLNGVSAKQAYQLVLNETGSYKVVYSVFDGAGMERTETFMFDVVKYQDPVITVAGDLQERVKAGEVVNIPAMSATFVQENEKNMTWIVVISPSTNTYTLITDADRAFKATELGDYKVRFCAIDAYGSYSIVEYVVTCYA